MSPGPANCAAGMALLESASLVRMPVLVTVDSPPTRKQLAKDLELRLFELGNDVYHLGIGTVLYGVDADVEREDANRGEHVRRLAAIANLMLDAGVILVITASERTQSDLGLVRTAVEPDRTPSRRPRRSVRRRRE